TGMGLERLTAVMQGKTAVFETDLFAPVVEAILHGFKVKIEENLLDKRAAVYAIADHARALTFLIADGVVPSNDGRGYVLRMLLRKAVRAGRSLGFREPFIHKLVNKVIEAMELGYPELSNRFEPISRMICIEEERFFQTLEEKIPLAEQIVQALIDKVAGKPSGPNESRAVLLPEDAAKLYDTHGLSYEEIAEVCRKYSVIPPDKKLFEQALEGLQAQSKAGASFGSIFSKDALAELLSDKPPTEFLGYGHDLTAQVKVLCLVQEGRSLQEVKAPAPVEVILDRSPFYGESGGQVGDTGMLVSDEGRFRVEDTQWVGNVLVHRGELLEGRLRVGDKVDSGVDAGRRRHIAQNHTATHLLHSALRKVLGEHVMQAGSLVAPDHLRLDFSHGQGLSGSQRDSVESLVNEWVEKNYPVRVDKMGIDEAKKTGAMALFGEKYGSQVRVVSIGDISKELCGGTHLEGSAEVGFLTIAEEGSIASGIRRVEALTAQAALDSVKTEVVRLQQERERLVKRNKQLEQERSSLKVKGAA
ncbi:MAG: alanine--tRNA ligase, partial [Candidatus Omnitrophota bacterium]|nr:alanine--tRNA ligase [Candidatus Omnitrophota bacterium]